MGLSDAKKINLDQVQEVLNLTQLVHEAINVEMTNLKVIVSKRSFKDEKWILLGLRQIDIVIHGSSYSGRYGLVSWNTSNNLSGLKATGTSPIKSR